MWGFYVSKYFIYLFTFIKIYVIYSAILQFPFYRDSAKVEGSTDNKEFDY